MRFKRALIYLLTIATVISFIFFIFKRITSDNLPSSEKVVYEFNKNKNYFFDLSKTIQESVIEESLNQEDLYKYNNQFISYFKDLDFYQISEVKEEGIYFVRKNYWNFSIGIYYSYSGEEPQSNYITSVQVLEGNWYLYKMK